MDRNHFIVLPGGHTIDASRISSIILRLEDPPRVIVDCGPYTVVLKTETPADAELLSKFLHEFIAGALACDKKAAGKTKKKAP